MKRATLPRYTFIALDIARKIMNVEIKPGEKLKGRTLLASQYNVSPETIRKAAEQLEANGIVENRPGIGIYVLDIVKAEEFTLAYKSDKSIRQQQDELQSLIQQKEELDAKVISTMKKVVESFKYRTSEAIKFYETEVLEGSLVIGKTIGETKFFQNTGATVIAIIHDDVIQISPGPQAEILEGDFLVYVGDDEVQQRVEKYLDEGMPWQK